MPQIDEIYIPSEFDPKRHTTTLNKILEDIYLALDQSSDIGSSAAQVYRSSPKTLSSGTWTTIDGFDFTNFDNKQQFDSDTADRLTCKKDGLYVIYGNYYDGTVGGSNHFIRLSINGTDVAQDGPTDGAYGGSHRQTIYAEVEMLIGDYLQLRVFRASGAGSSIRTGNFGNTLGFRQVGKRLSV